MMREGAQNEQTKRSIPTNGAPMQRGYTLRRSKKRRSRERNIEREKAEERPLAAVRHGAPP